jgi:hypothetical protein
MRAIIFVSIYVLIFCCISLIIFRKADGDRNRIIFWAKNLYVFLNIISFALLGLETYKLGAKMSINLQKSNILLLAIFNFLFFLMILLVSWTQSRIINGKVKGKYRVEYIQRKGNFLLMISVIAGPILNCYFIYNYIMSID